MVQRKDIQKAVLKLRFRAEHSLLLALLAAACMYSNSVSDHKIKTTALIHAGVQRIFLKVIYIRFLFPDLWI